MLDLSFDHTVQWVCIAIAGICLGFSKAGLPSIGMASISFLIIFFHPKDFIAIILPLLVVGDFLASSYYYSYVPFKLFRQNIPIILLGMFLGSLVLAKIPNDEVFLNLIGWILLSLISLRILSAQKWVRKFFSNPKTGRILVFFSSMTTTVSHAGGPYMAIYYLNKNLEKKSFLGIYAMTFLMINIIKVPIFLYNGLISPKTLYFSLFGVPFIFIGSLLGRSVVDYIPQKIFNATVITLIFVAACRLIMK